MKGLKLSRRYYDVCRPLLAESIPDIMAVSAAGLAGEGSECFGCDDAYSRDHDFGPAFCLWLDDNLILANRDRIAAAFSRLPATFMNMPARMDCHGRTGPLGIKSFFSFLTGLDHAPIGWREWLGLSEEKLATAVNGEVFEDNAGIFGSWRKALLEFYPRDVWLKKLCARTMNMAQAGQYNLPRALQRGAGPAAMLACGEFSRAALSFVFLINRRYMPFYKWAPALCSDLPVLGRRLFDLLTQLAALPMRGPEDMEIAELVENFCVDCAGYLRATGLSNVPGSWLWEHGPAIISHVQQKEILKMDLLHA